MDASSRYQDSLPVTSDALLAQLDALGIAYARHDHVPLRTVADAKLVQDAGATMQEIVNDVVRVSSVISEISTAAAEQSSSIGQINQAVSHLDQMTQQNAALVEESTAAAASLTEQAQRLADAVNAFQTDAQRG